MGDEERKQEGEIAFDIAVNTFQTADNLRDMGFAEAGDVFEHQAQWAEQQARELGHQSDLNAQQQAELEAREPSLPKLDMTLPVDPIIYDDDHPRPQTMNPISPDERRRSIEHGEWVEETRRHFGETPHHEPHIDPAEPEVLTELPGQRLAPRNFTK
jgi:hypothetical protein